MTEKRLPLWDSDKQGQYWVATERLAIETAAKKDGEHTAASLDGILNDLSVEERSLIDYLLLSEKCTVVALYEDELFNGLVQKGLLRPPPGVGTLLMQELQTAYSVPRAVWKALNQRRGTLIPDGDFDRTRRLEELVKHFDKQVDALVEGPSTRSHD